MTTILPNPRRGEVWDVDFDPTIGAEIQKRRPAVVISVDSIGHLPIKLVAPITGWQKAFASKIWLVKVEPNRANGLTKVSAVDTLQIKAVDVQRFITKRGRLTAKLMTEIGAAIATIIDYR